MILQYIILFIMICMVIIIIRTENNLKLVIMLCAFSLMASSLYFIYAAPDVALAEISIGCGIVPLIFIVAISKQKEFIVINHMKKPCKVIFNILEEFCSSNNLKLKVLHSRESHIHGIFREKNIDLIMEECIETKRCLIKVKESNVLMKKLEKMTREMKNIIVVKEGEDETLD